MWYNFLGLYWTIEDLPMTICVSIKVSEGLVLATDSTAAIQGTVQDPTGKSSTGILKTYDHVRKLSHIKDYPIGTLTWGTALVGARSVESLIKEYEYTLLSLEEEQEKIKERRMRGKAKGDERFEYNVRNVAEGLLDHVKKFYETEFASQPVDQRPQLGILVSGYSSGKFFPEQWLINLPISAELTGVRPDIDGKPVFGATWFGLADAIVRLHWGRDDAAPDILAQRFNVSPEEIRQLLARLEYPVIFDGMPLQDAIDYAVYLVNVAIGRFRFVAGAPLCGGEIDVAVITPNTFTWIQRKSWRVGTVLAK
jgi:hypothetical protein